MTVSRHSRSVLSGITLAALVLAWAIQARAGASVTREDAVRMREKLNVIAINGSTLKPVSRRTALLEQEVNAFLTYEVRDQLPEGVMDPTVSILGDGHLAGAAVVDLDVVRRAKKRGFFDPMGYMGGRVPVTASGTLTTEAGVGRFTLDSAEVSGVRIPKIVLQELVSFYSRTPENPEGFTLDDPFPLPAGIRQIEVGRGQAIIVQ
jgi:hypothetical protein